MRILFIGTVDFSYHVLQKLVDLKVEITGVLTKEKSTFNSDFRDLAPICIKNSINYKYVKNINHEANIKWVRNRNPDVIFCFGWSQLLGSELLSIPPLGVIGNHPAKLPHNKGRHPLIWALCLGLKETASTFFFMDKGADTGDILSQESIKINNSDNAQSLYNKIVDVSLKQVEKFLPELESGNYNRIPQDKNAGNSWRKRSSKDGNIDWRMSAENIYNLVRGLTKPYIGAHFEYNSQNVIVWSAKKSKYGRKNNEPGKVIGLKNGQPIIKCGDNSIIIEEMEPIIDLYIGDYL